jgi:hypothetical protein
MQRWQALFARWVALGARAAFWPLALAGFLIGRLRLDDLCYQNSYQLAIKLAVSL